jgi:hypothetical protein
MMVQIRSFRSDSNHEERHAMQEHQTSNNVPLVPDPRRNQELRDAWREVGAQFQQLGTRLASALRRSSQSSGDQKTASVEMMRNLRDDLKEAANRVDRVIQDISEETIADREATLRATRRASAQSLEEARILTAATLRKLNRQLDHLVRRLEEDEIRQDR